MAFSEKTLQLIAEAKARTAARAAQVIANSALPANLQPAETATAAATVAAGQAVNKQQDPVSAMDAILSQAASNQASLPATFNKEQQEAITLAMQGKSFCLIGAAGTGKTTTTQKIIMELQQAPHVGTLEFSTKWLQEGAPSIVVVGYTNKAVNNIRKRLPPHIARHCITIHKLLEFEPVVTENELEDGTIKKSMIFEPARNAMKKLPHIAAIISEESSMTGTDLWGQLIAALPNPSRTQFLMLGDLNQLPPVFGPSILGFKLLDLPVVELTHVYRQALESPIISLATAIRTCEKLRGSTADLSRLITKLEAPVTVDKGEHGIVTIRPWKMRLDWETAIYQMRKFLAGLIESGNLDPEKDIILCPFNKSFGTIELNKIIADYLGKKRGEKVWEIRARQEKHYLAVGDRVLYDRHEAVITEIFPTVGYAGRATQPESLTLNRWGHDPMSSEETTKQLMSADDAFAVIESMAAMADEESKNLCSHTIKVYIPDLDKTETIKSAGELNKMLLGYALTVHKSQGSEWERVFILLHSSHAKGTLLSRELLYTAVTRAKKELHIICEGDMTKNRLKYTNSILKAAESPVITGVTLAEKALWFRGTADAYNEM